VKRSGISRGKGFKPRASALSRRGALQRGAEMSRKASRAKSAKAHVWPTGLRDFVLARADGRCDMCGKPLPYRWECHHRRLLAQGGTDDPTNLLALDYPCHAEAHEERTWARDHGYIVHRGTDPAERPVWRHGRVWQLPTDGGWVDCDPPTDITTERTAA
jgi:hypothetical protein